MYIKNTIDNSSSHLDNTVLHDEAGYRRHGTVFNFFFVLAENVNCSGRVVVTVFSVEPEAVQNVVVVGNLQHTVLSVAALNAGLRVARDGDGVILLTVCDGEAVVLVITLLEIAGVSRLDLMEAIRLKVVVGGNRIRCG